MIDSGYSGLSIAQQCQLVSISRSSYYYAPSNESDLNLRLMALIDRQILDTQFCIEALEEALEKYGVPEIFNTDQGS